MAEKFKYKEYQSAYAAQIQKLLDERERTDKAYDYENDPSYIAARNEFERKQQYASESTRARMNSAVGGSGSGSATATAMAQVNNDYIKRITDLIPLYKQQALDSLSARIESLQKADKDAYDKYKDARDFAYDEYIAAQNDAHRKSQDAYKKSQDKKAFNYKKAQDKKKLKYQKSQDSKKFEYKKTVDNRAYALQLANAKRAAASAKKASSKNFSGLPNGGTSVEKVRENIIQYARFLWNQSVKDAKAYTFNYIRSFGLTRKEELMIINCLPKRNKKSPLYWYESLGYSQVKRKG